MLLQLVTVALAFHGRPAAPTRSIAARIHRHPPPLFQLSERQQENREIAALAGPAVLNVLIDPILSLVDTIWVGRLALPFALGATACASEIFTLSFAFSLALRESASSTIARRWASGQRAGAAAFARRTLQLAVCIGLALALLIGGPSAPWCVGLMGAHHGSPLHADALAYARVRAAGLPFALSCSAAEGVFRGLGDTRAPLRAAAVAAIVNAALDPVFIFPRGLGMGVAGAAAATVVAQAVALSLLAAYLLPRLREASLAGDSVPEVVSDGAGGGGEAARSVAGTSIASLLRTSSILGCWVYIASAVSRMLGPAAIASHGVVLKVWLLFVLAAEAPAVAGQILCASRLSSGEPASARALLLRMLRLSALLGAMSAGAMLLVGPPASAFFFGADPATALATRRLFRWAAAVSALVVPTIVCEAVLQGAGKSYSYLGLMTLANALVVGSLTRTALRARPVPGTAWACIILFFGLRFATAASRVFGPRGGFGPWREAPRRPSDE